MQPSMRDIIAVYGRIGLLSFGGPAGQIALMHRILVEERGWLDDRRFLHALNFCMLLPGPEAQQLSVYSGWLVGGLRGGLIAGLLFVLPGLLAIMAFSWIYALYGTLDLVAGLFLGLKAAVLAIVLQALRAVARRALTDRVQVALAIAAFVAIFVAGLPFPLIIAAAALIGLIAGQAAEQPIADVSTTGSRSTWRGALGAALAWLAPLAVLVVALGPDHVYAQIAVFFSQMAVVTFGGAYAVLAYVAQQAVDGYGWLAPGEMLDGLGLAETTPGPLIMVTQFVGFLGAFRDPGSLHPLVAGTLGGLLTTWVTFAPCFLWIFLLAPFVERLHGNARLAAALRAITAAVVGVIANLALWFALHVLFATLRPIGAMDLPVLTSLDPIATGLTALALVATFGLKWNAPAVLGGIGGLGMALRLGGLA